MSGQLFIVATPIGNLDDISRRAIEILSRVDLIAAEDTRHSRKLLNHLAIKKDMVSLHEHNERQRIELMLQHLHSGASLALISDAGTPLISDPGYPLVRAVIEAGFLVTPIPGACSIIAALSAAGLPTDRFCFHGFLPQKDQPRLTQLNEIRHLPGTQVLLESTHRIHRLLQQLSETWPSANVVLAKELTKSHENFIRGSARQCLDTLEKDPALHKGEFVVLLYEETVPSADSESIATDQLLAVLLAEMPVSKAVKLAAAISGKKKNQLYARALEMSDDGKG